MAWPVVTTLLPLGINSRDADATGTSYELAFIGLLLGAISATIALDRLRPTLIRAPWRLRWSIVYATAVLATLAGGSLAFVAFQAARRTEWASTVWPDCLPEIALSALHLGAIVMTIHAAPLPASARSPVLVATAWALPALAPAAFAPIALLRAGVHPLHGSLSNDWTAPAIEFVPIVAWLAAALLLEVPRPRRA